MPRLQQRYVTHVNHLWYFLQPKILALKNVLIITILVMTLEHVCNVLKDVQIASSHRKELSNVQDVISDLKVSWANV
jgi:hypothetical protein